jgi:hypothetical protein
VASWPHKMGNYDPAALPVNPDSKSILSNIGPR